MLFSELYKIMVNLNPEADDVNTLSDEFVKIFNDTLDTHAQYRLHLEKNNAPLTNHGSPKAF